MAKSRKSGGGKRSWGAGKANPVPRTTAHGPEHSLRSLKGAPAPHHTGKKV